MGKLIQTDESIQNFLMGRGLVTCQPSSCSNTFNMLDCSVFPSTFPKQGSFYNLRIICRTIDLQWDIWLILICQSTVILWTVIHELTNSWKWWWTCHHAPKQLLMHITDTCTSKQAFILLCFMMDVTWPALSRSCCLDFATRMDYPLNWKLK